MHSCQNLQPYDPQQHSQCHRSKAQNGFRGRPGRYFVTQILTLRRIIEGVKANHLPAITTFIDFKKAFYSIHK